MQTHSERTRPLYETEDNLREQEGVARLVEEKWKCKFVKLKKAYALDYAVLRGGKIVAFAEVKCRNYTMEKLNSFGGFMLSLHKWTEAKNISGVSGVPFVLIVKTIDGFWHHSTTGFETDGISFGGRTDRNDLQDVEPVVILKGGRFKKLANPERQPPGA